MLSCQVVIFWHLPHRHQSSLSTLDASELPTEANYECQNSTMAMVIPILLLGRFLTHLFSWPSPQGSALGFKIQNIGLDGWIVCMYLNGSKSATPMRERLNISAFSSLHSSDIIKKKKSERKHINVMV